MGFIRTQCQGIQHAKRTSHFDDKVFQLAAESFEERKQQRVYGASAVWVNCEYVLA